MASAASFADVAEHLRRSAQPLQEMKLHPAGCNVHSGPAINTATKTTAREMARGLGRSLHRNCRETANSTGRSRQSRAQANQRPQNSRDNRLHFIGVQADAPAISRSAFTVRQFLVVATRENFFSMVVLVSLLMPRSE